LASRVKLGICGRDNEVPQRVAETVSKAMVKLACSAVVLCGKTWGVRVCFIEIFYDPNRVSDIRPSGRVVNGREGVMVAPIRFFVCRRDSEFLAEQFNARIPDPLGFIRNPLEISGKEGYG
jgi:hypothetical protein